MIDTGALLGLDIGGTLAKMVLFVPEDRANLLKEVAEHFATVGASGCTDSRDTTGVSGCRVSSAWLLLPPLPLSL